MPEVVTCLQCQKKLRVPDHLLGRQVKCPICGAILSTSAPAAPSSSPLVAQEVEEPPAQPAPPPSTEEYEEESEEEYEERPEYEKQYDRPRRRRRPVAPHRGALILTLGILSLLLCGIFTGIPAWIMGNNDLAEMRAGRMDRSGEGMTQAGRICGMISVILSIACGSVWILLVLIGIIAGRH